MHERAEDQVACVMNADDEILAAELESRLVDSSTLVFRVAFSVLRHREDAEYVAQEAFIRAYRQLWRLRNRERFRSWIVRLAWRLALDRRRSDRRRTAREAAAMDEGTGRSEADAGALWDAIDRLPEQLRIAIVLSSIEGHDIRAVATLLRVPEGTVKPRLFRARRLLKEMLSGTR